MLVAEGRAIAGGELRAIHAVGQIGDPIMRELRLRLVQLALPHANHLVGILQHAARTQQRAKEPAPFGLVRDGLEQFLAFRRGHVEDAAVQRHDERFAAQASGRAHGSAHPLKGVGVEQPDVGRGEQGAEEGERKQVAALPVQRRAVGPAEPEERIGVGEAPHGHAADLFRVTTRQRHRGENQRLGPGALLLAREFENYRLGTAPFLSHEAARDVDNAVGSSASHERRNRNVPPSSRSTWKPRFTRLATIW